MIQPGLERIGLLLKNVQFPWKTIHVAGTNGKGTICYHASSLLTRRTVRVGKFTSPHLIDRWDCITINNKVVSEETFKQVEERYVQVNKEENINASPFEILTATAFTLFNEAKVDVGVIEVGMGGKLDATNILNNQVVSVISKIARDHEGFLGNTLEEIAKHKAGILRPNVPYIVNPMNEWYVHDVIDEYAKEIGAGPRLHGDTPELKEHLYSSQEWRKFAETLRPFQRDNAVLAIVAVKEALKSLDVIMKDTTILGALCRLRHRTNLGRLHDVQVQPVFGDTRGKGRDILVDGAHNPDAAIALAEYVDNNKRREPVGARVPATDGLPVTWVLAMTEGKDARQYLSTLLRPRDNVITTSFGPVDGMPWVKPMDPSDLLKIVKRSASGITGLAMPKAGALRALCASKYLTRRCQPIVLTGSLYLVGDFYRELRAVGGLRPKPQSLPGHKRKQETNFWLDEEFGADREVFEKLQKVERERVNRLLSGHDIATLELNEDSSETESAAQRKRRLQAEIDTLDREIEQLELEEHQISQVHPAASTSTAEQDETANVDEPATPLTPPSRNNNFYTHFEDIRKTLEALEARRFAGKFKELRGRKKKLTSELKHIERKDSSSEGEGHVDRKSPKIRMHFAHTKGGNDRRFMIRPGFIQRRKGEA